MLLGGVSFGFGLLLRLGEVNTLLLVTRIRVRFVGQTGGVGAAALRPEG